MSEDKDALLDATTALVPALLTALEGLEYAGRHLHPPQVREVVAAVAEFQQPLADGLAVFNATEWPEHLHRFREHMGQAASAALQSYDGLTKSAGAENPIMSAYRAMRFNTRALEALYPVSAMLPPVSRFFLNADQRENERLNGLITDAFNGSPPEVDVGVLHAANGPKDRGGFSLYVPEYYTPDLKADGWPLVVALHGGSGHGRDFLWSWLRDARSREMLLLSPSSRDQTWSLMGPDIDHANLMRMIDYVKEQYRVDEEHILLTGMSDGGTFTWMSGLVETDGPYTHLAPIASSFHPMLMEGIEPDRLKSLPIYLTHGALDWMFPIDVARGARDALAAAGADVTYREIDDLSHTYPREENARILDWVFGA